MCPENVRVGESGDRLARAEKALQQAERRVQSPDDDEVISTLHKSNRGLREKDHPEGDRCHEHNVPTIDKIEKTVEVHQVQFLCQVVDVQLSRNDECL